MVRTLWLVALLAGCRLRFDDVPDAARDVMSDAPPLGLACNTPVQVAGFSATNPRLTATVVGATLIAAWIGDDGVAVSAGIHFYAPDSVDANVSDPMIGALVGSISAVSVATDSGLVIAAMTPIGATATRVFVFDMAAQARAMANIDDFHLESSRGVSSIRGGPPLFAIAGSRQSTARSVVIGLDANGKPITAALDIGIANPRTQLTPLADGAMVEETSAVNNCTAVRINGDMTMHGAFTAWGTNGQCLQGIGGFAPGSGTVLMARGDMTDGDINHVIGTLGNGLAVTIPGESRLRTPAREGRIAGLANGFWTTYETGGTLEAALVDLGGVAATPKPLGPLASATAHEVVLRDADAYAVWIERGLWLARLCP